ncbi:MAG: hypothetical protein AB7Q01_08640 [Gammaproteobacteria bacterium]
MSIRSNTRFHRHNESSRTFIRERCARCRESYPIGTLQGGTCSLCKAEVLDLAYEERQEFARRYGGR